jgi:flagellar basal-body rod modification protein FlgD
MAVAAVSSSTSGVNSLGLDFQSLLQIILTQLQYQDPLKPLDNFEFVSQLAQFTGLEQTQQLNSQISNLLLIQSATQATGLLGKIVNVQKSGGSPYTGTVSGISFSSGTPSLTVTAADGTTVPNVSLSDVVEVQSTPASTSTTGGS